MDFPEGSEATPLTAEPTRRHRIGMKTVVAQLREGVVVLSGGVHGRVLAASGAARDLGLVEGTKIVPQPLRDAVREVRETGRRSELSFQTPAYAAQPARHFEVTVTPLPDGAVLVEAVDQSTLQRVDATRRDFIANVSHELKTPIGGVLLLAEAIEEAHKDPEAVQHFAERLKEEAIRLADMVTQLIDLSRLQSQDPLRSAEPVDMEEVVDDALGRCNVKAARKKITLLTRGDVGGVVWGDEPNLIDAIANLVSNAIAYSDPGSRVVTTLRRVSDAGGSWIEVAVADKGIGIKPEDLDRIFERFYRVDYGRSRAHGGTGLGLSLVRHVAEAHGGSVRVSSAVGEGSTFTLKFPEYQPQPTVEASP